MLSASKSSNITPEIPISAFQNSGSDFACRFSNASSLVDLYKCGDDSSPHLCRASLQGIWGGAGVTGTAGAAFEFILLS